MKIGDVVKLGRHTFTVKKAQPGGFHLHAYGESNDIIFTELCLNSREFARKVLGYGTNGIFPECKTLSDLEKLVNALQEKLKPSTMKHNFPENTRVICKTKLNKDQIKEVMKLAIDAEIDANSGVSSYVRDLEQGQLLHVDEDMELFTRLDPADECGGKIRAITVSFTEFKKFFIGQGKINVFKPKSIKLNSEYTAVVHESHVQVGCQRIEFDAVQELMNAVTAVQSKK